MFALTSSCMLLFRFQIFAGIHPVPDSRHKIVNEQEDEENARPPCHQFEFRNLLSASSSSSSFVFGGGGFICFCGRYFCAPHPENHRKDMDHECGEREHNKT